MIKYQKIETKQTKIESSIDDILAQVDLSERSQEEVLPQKKTKKTYDNKCWHQDGCDNLAAKRLHMNTDLIKINAKFVSSNMKKFPNSNQLCMSHFNDPTYSSQKRNSSFIENI